MRQKALYEAQIAEQLMNEAANPELDPIHKGLMIDAASVHAQLSTTAAILELALPLEERQANRLEELQAHMRSAHQQHP